MLGIFPLKVCIMTLGENHVCFSIDVTWFWLVYNMVSKYWHDSSCEKQLLRCLIYDLNLEYWNNVSTDYNYWGCLLILVKIRVSVVKCQRLYASLVTLVTLINQMLLTSVHFPHPGLKPWWSRWEKCKIIIWRVMLNFIPKPLYICTWICRMNCFPNPSTIIYKMMMSLELDISSTGMQVLAKVVLIQYTFISINKHFLFQG